jgi:hypothetical protein
MNFFAVTDDSGRGSSRRRFGCRLISPKSLAISGLFLEKFLIADRSSRNAFNYLKPLERPIS